MCVCVCECVRERKRESVYVCEKKREKEREYVCVRERKRERESQLACLLLVITVLPEKITLTTENWSQAMVYLVSIQQLRTEQSFQFNEVFCLLRFPA